MKQTIEVPWSVGDIVWGILDRSDRQSVQCKECKHTSYEPVHTIEVKQCQIDAIHLTVSTNPLHLWYAVNFNGYGVQLSNVYASRKEAEDALSQENKS